MNKKEILDKIKSLDGLNNDEKAYLVNLVNTKKKYGLVWEDKPEDVEEELRTKLPVLKEVKERAIINDTETEKHPNHILIEGDNLHALTALTFTHEGKIDIIYIDPPYGIKFNSNFQWSTTSRDVKDGNRDHVTREPEQVKAFRILDRELDPEMEGEAVTATRKIKRSLLHKHFGHLIDQMYSDDEETRISRQMKQ